MLLIQAYDWAGRTATWMGRITRSSGPPAVEQWDAPFAETGGKWEGLLPDAMRSALEHNASYAGAFQN